MAANTTLRLRRTQKGEDEIRQKTHSLTQSERLVLALIDGVTPTEGLKRKLQGMVERRFKLVIADLMAKGLLEEASLSVPQVTSFNLASMQRYVLQDPLDPITITALTLPEQRSRIAKVDMTAPKRRQATLPPSSPTRSDIEAHGVDFYLPLEVQSENVEQKPVWDAPVVPNMVTGNSMDERGSSSKRRIRRARRSRQVQIGYWLLFVALVAVVLLALFEKYK